MIGEVKFCMTADVRNFCKKTMDKKSPKTQTKPNKQVQDQYLIKGPIIYFFGGRSHQVINRVSSFSRCLNGKFP